MLFHYNTTKLTIILRNGNDIVCQTRRRKVALSGRVKLIVQAVLLLAVSTIRGPEKRGKPQIMREKRRFSPY